MRDVYKPSSDHILRTVPHSDTYQYLAQTRANCESMYSDAPVRECRVTGGPPASQMEQLVQYEEIVFARTTPDQKLLIVNELKGRGNIVAMTGDV